MKNLIGKTALAGLTALTLAGCAPKQYNQKGDCFESVMDSTRTLFLGGFRGHPAEVETCQNSPTRRIIIHFENATDSPYLIGYDKDGDGRFEEIIGWRDGPLGIYADNDSLRAAYKEILGQNGGAHF